MFSRFGVHEGVEIEQQFILAGLPYTIGTHDGREITRMLGPCNHCNRLSNKDIEADIPGHRRNAGDNMQWIRLERRHKMHNCGEGTLG